MDSDPSIRWQVMRDLKDEPGDVVAAERSKVVSKERGTPARSPELEASGAIARTRGRGPPHLDIVAPA